MRDALSSDYAESDFLEGFKRKEAGRGGNYLEEK